MIQVKMQIMYVFIITNHYPIMISAIAPVGNNQTLFFGNEGGKNIGWDFGQTGEHTCDFGSKACNKIFADV